MGKHEDILNLEVDPSHINPVDTAQAAVVPPKIESSKNNIPGGKKRIPTKMLFIGGGVLIALITVGIILYLITSGVNKEDVEFEFSGPSTVESGDEVTFKIGYANNNPRITMQDTELLLTLPKGFEFVSSSLTPTDLANGVWNLGEVSPETEQILEVKAKFFGDVDSNVTLVGTLSFTPSTIGKKISTTAEYSPRIVAPRVSLDLQAPETLNAGSQIIYQLDIANDKNTNYDNALIKFSLPKGFTASSDSSPDTVDADAPKYDKESDMWKLGTLKAGQKKTIKLTGRLDGANGEQQNVGVQLLLANNGTNYIQEEVSKVTVISSPSISIQQEASVAVASAGDEVRFLLTIKNTGNSPLTNLTLTDSLTSKVVNPSSLRIDSSGTFKDSSVVWDNTVVSTLKLLNPNQEFKIGFSLSAHKDITVTGKEFSIVATPKITTGSQEVLGQSATVKIKTTVDVAAAASAFDTAGNPIGSGPTTPTVGKTTTYRLSFTITNKYNTLENAKLVCNIPLGATYASSAKTDPGTVVFDGTLKNAIWTLGTMTAKTEGTGKSVAVGYFDVSVTPSAPTLGQKMTLAQKCVVSGRDPYANQDITVNLKDFITEKVQ